MSKVRIKVRQLDTGEASQVALDASPPDTPPEQRSHLVALVREVHPQARIRSFADGVATFLGPGHLVIAAYDPRPLKRRRRKDSPPRGQDELFAA